MHVYVRTLVSTPKVSYGGLHVCMELTIHIHIHCTLPRVLLRTSALPIGLVVVLCVSKHIAWSVYM